MVHGMIMPGMPVLHVMMLFSFGRSGLRRMVMGVLIRHVMMLHAGLVFVTFVSFVHSSTPLPDPESHFDQPGGIRERPSPLLDQDFIITKSILNFLSAFRAWG
jgi:hypothetical protein